jgi:RNA polymerase sigma factor (TIGR02999 family)
MSAEHDPASDDGLDEQFTGLYATLRRLAAQTVKGRGGERVLEPTELVHELYIKLAKRRLDGLPRTELLALAASALRSVLVDHARARATLKRGGSYRQLTLNGGNLVQGQELDILVLHDSLTKLAGLDARMARVAELRFFAGLGVDETARVMGIAPSTVDSEWAMAKAWLHRELAP